MFPSPKNYTEKDIHVGLKETFTRDLTLDDVLDFAKVSGDFNPLHVDPDYAVSTYFGHCIVHGALQIGLASAMLGMYLPGRRALLCNVNSQFSSPLEIPASVKVEGEITAWHQEMNSGMLRVTIIERDTHKITAIISLNFTLHGEKHQADVSVKETAITSVLQEETPCVIVTGAAGGIGANIVEHLLDRYRVLAIVNRQQMPEQIQTNQNLQVTKADLNDPNGYARIEEALLKENLYAIIHLACPPPLPGGLLSVNREALQAQFEFGSVHLIRLACLLNDHAKDGGRLVALGSDWGERRPKLNLASYSLGKSALEQTVKLLAPELAPKGISVNAICPNMLPLGMNVQINSRQLKIAESQIPAGRLCNTTDILSTVDWLLSSGSEYFSGQSVNLTGGSI